ncbi:MAG: uracil-DNA glycosylase [Gemmatimonadales bacterium]
MRGSDRQQAASFSYLSPEARATQDHPLRSGRVSRLPAGASPLTLFGAMMRAPTSLTALNDRIIACERCPRLRAHCRRVALAKKREFRDQEYWGKPVPGFGDPRARLLVVGLAPAAHGGNRTGRVFTGDSSGDWLYTALHRFGFANQAVSRGRGDGLRLTDCYVTAAARCAPPGNKPGARELERCRPYLEAEIELLDKLRVVVVLGRIAYESWLRAAGWWGVLRPAERPRFEHGAASRLPDGTILVCSYHPSRQNTNTGRLTRAMWHRVFRRAREILEGAEGPLVLVPMILKGIQPFP